VAFTTELRMQQSDFGAEADGDEGHYFFFSAPASPVHYILRSPPSSTAGPAAAAASDGGDSCAGHGAVGDFEFFAARAAGGGMMSSAEDLFVAGRIRVGGGGLSPIRQEDTGREDGGSGDEDGRDGGRATRARRARSASPPRSPRAAAEPSPSSSSSSSSSAKSTRRRISLRDLLTGMGGGDSGSDPSGISNTGFWPPSIWPSRSKKAVLPCPAPLPGRRSTSSDRAAAAPAKKPGGARRTTSLPYRQGLVLGCLGFGPRSCGLAKSMHPLYSR
jgi:hypothetical protein